MKTSIIANFRQLSFLLAIACLSWQCGGTAGESSTDGPGGNLYERYYETYPAPPPVRAGGSDAEREVWNRATTNYGNGDYIGAIEAFKEALNNDRPPKSTVNFYLGLCHMELSPSRPKKAIDYFNEAVKNRKGRYYEAIRWYRAMAYLSQGEISETRIYLERIKQEADEYKKDEVIKLLSQLPGQ